MSSEKGPETSKVGRGQSLASRANLRPGNWRSRAQEEGASQEGPQLPADEHEQDQLVDMRWVYSHPKAEDRTEGQRLCRKWLQEDVAGFMRAKSVIEAKVRGEWDGKGACPVCKREGERGGPLPMDAGTERVLAAIKKLEEWAKKEGKEGWK